MRAGTHINCASIAVVVLAILFNQAARAATTQPASAPAIRVDETLLYRIPGSVRIADTITSPDTRHVACVEERASGADRTFDVAMDGAAGPRVQWIVGQSLIFSPDGSRVSWQTQDASISVVVDSVEHLLHPGSGGESSPAMMGPGYWLAGHVLFSKDGRHNAFPAQLQQNDKPPWRMIVDGKAGESYDALDDSQMDFSPDGSRLAYKAARSGRQLFVIDDAPGPGYDLVSSPVFSDNGAHVAYVAKQGNEECYVIDGKEGTHYELTAALCFAPGGRRYAYAAGKAGKQMLVVDGKAYKPFDGISDLAFSPDGRRIAVTAFSGQKWTTVIDGKETGSYDGCGAVHFSPDSKRLAFVAGRGRRQLAVTDSREGPVFDGVGSLAFSPDGSQVGYLAVDGTARLLVVNGKTIGPAGAFAFSPDGRHVARTVPLANNRWGLAIDGIAAEATYDGFPLGSRIVWDSPDIARTIAGRGSDLIRVELHVQ